MPGRKRLERQTEATLVKIQPQNHQNVKKPQFWQKVTGVNGLNTVENNLLRLKPSS